MAGTYTMKDVLDWQRKSEMQLLIRASEGDPVPLTYTVIPLTTNLGLNESQLTRGVSNNHPNTLALESSPLLTCN